MTYPKYEKIGDPLICLMEECGELIQILAKTKRFGANNYHPNDKKKTPNHILVFREIDDVEKRIKEVKELFNYGDYLEQK